METTVEINGLNVTVYAQKRTMKLGSKSHGRVRWYGVTVAGHAYLNEGGFSSVFDAVSYAKRQIARYSL
jgi:hypothetical protein